MAHIWCKDDTLTWKPLELAEGPLELATEDAGGGVWVCRAHGERPVDTWVLVCGREPAVRVNGLLLQTGIQVLADRDEIAVEGKEPVFFSTETLARAETFQGGEAEVLCPRCKRPLEDGARVVKCPLCGLIYHHGSERDSDCWTYGPSCCCGQTTAMDAGFRWTPDEMWE